MTNKEYPMVHAMHESLSRLLPLYRTIRDCLSGEKAVKEQGEVYLPHPGKEKCPSQRKDRYKDYRTRAVFYNVTRRTVKGLVGQVFMKDPIIEMPVGLELMAEDASGKGVPIEQEAKKCLNLTLAYSRAGIMVDYPSVEGPLTKLEVSEGRIRPTINIFSAEEIVNWRVIQRGADKLLSMVCLYEHYEFADDGFEIQTAEQYRVLRLDSNGDYYQEIWREEEPDTEKRTDPYDIKRESSSVGIKPKWKMYEKVYPLDSQGNNFKEIPFTFVGSENNDPDPDYPNIYDLASLNIAHYRNSADYEECVFFSGQPTMVISGLSKDWYQDVLEGEILVGSRGGIPLPESGVGKLLQASDKMPAKDAMEHKERQMVALGAKLVEQRKTERTAFEVKLEATADGSILSNTTKNVSAAFSKAILWAAAFAGAEPTVTFELNVEYDLVRMTPDDIQQLIATWQEGLMGFAEARKKLREGGMTCMEDEEVLAEYKSRKEEEIEMQRQQFAAENAGNENEEKEEGEES